MGGIKQACVPRKFGFLLSLPAACLKTQSLLWIIYHSGPSWLSVYRFILRKISVFPALPHRIRVQ